MRKQPLVPILAGVFIGIVLFAVPFFLFKMAMFVLIFGGLFRLMARRRFRGGQGYRQPLHPVMTDVIRRMNDQEYSEFRQSLERPYRSYQAQEIPIEIQ